MGRRLLEAIGAAASMKAKCNCDLGSFADGPLALNPARKIFRSNKTPAEVYSLAFRTE